MNNEKVTNDLVEQLTEGLGEDAVAKQEVRPVEIKLEEEPAVEESVVEEPPIEESVVEEPAVEEPVVEESVAEESSKEESAEEGVAEATVEEAAAEPPVEEASSEETPAEETSAEETSAEKKKKPVGLIGGIVAAALVAVLAAAYLIVANRYTDCFFEGTLVNGVDCSGMKIEEVEEILQGQVEEYVLDVTTSSGEVEQIKGTDIEITYVGYNQIKEAFKEQNKYLWPKSFLENREIEAEIKFDYNIEKLDETIAALEFMKAENQVAPVDATVVYKDGKYEIQDEVYGTQVDAAKVSEAIYTAVATMADNVNIQDAGCYIQPKYTKESQEVLDAQAELNKYLSASITYSLEGKTVTVDSEKIAGWISVDENMKPSISSDKVESFAKTLGKTYNTANKSGVIITPTGKEAKVKNATLGRTVGTDKESKQLISEIKAGKTVTREPIFSREEMAEGEYVWGDTYVEVDLTEQHMWFIQNGEVTFETDVVTGHKGKNDTPTGTFTILEKMRNKTLRGRLVNGKPSYLTPVDYWMRITWSGVGFHDADWRSVFGGDEYIKDGSHGCINMPPKKAKEFYNMLSKGTQVVIHN